MFKFGKKKPLQIDVPEPQMRSKSNSFSLISPRPHHSITFNRRGSEKLPDVSHEQLKFGQKPLPPNFAEDLLELEIDIEINENVPLDTFQKLIQMYMVGVEHHESMKSRKHLYFQRKLNNLMIKPSFIMSASKPQTAIVVEQTQSPDNSFKKKEFQDQQKKLQLDLIYGETESKEAKVQEIVDQHTISLKRMDDLIQHDMQQQEDNIKQRLEKRKKTLSRASSLPRLSVEESILAEVSQQLALNPEEQPENQSPMKQKEDQIDAISEEDDDDAGPSRKTSLKQNRSKKSPSQLNFELPPTKTNLAKRQSVLVGLDVINLLLKRKENKCERAKSAQNSVNLKTDITPEKLKQELKDYHQTLNAAFQKMQQVRRPSK